MLSKSSFAYLTVLASLLDTTLCRERWLERDNRPVFLNPRRFNQEHPPVLDKLSNACPGQVCGALAGQAVTPLLAAQPECSQQDMADAIIDASKQFDAATQANMIALAIEYRQAEKNTPPDFTTNPPTLRNSVFCQKAPKNPELNGLIQAQDPANDPNLFFDPASKKTVRKGEQANTVPFGQAPSDEPVTATLSDSVAPTPVLVADATSSPCPTEITVTFTGNGAEITATNAITVSVGNEVVATTTSIAPATTGVTNEIGNFGSCSVPQIEFGVGFDGRKETSFQPVDKASYNHGSAQNIDIITQFICDTLVNSCGADQAARDTCATAKSAASAAAPKTGAQADAFNAVFGINTQFVDIDPVDDQGNIIGTGATTNSNSASPASTATPSSSTGPNQAAKTSGATVDTGVGNFGSCSVPQIEFGVGFDGRKETSFQPVDKASFNHGSAQNINIITQFICDTLVNSCGADQTAQNTCNQAKTAASAATPGTGAQADAFNAVFGVKTDFNDVTPVDNQGNPATGSTTSPTSNTALAQAVATSPPTATQDTSNGGQNIQVFTGALGGIKPPAVTPIASGKFQVDNNVFVDKPTALGRSCDVQQNACADAANASGNKAGFTVSACNQQNTQCKAAASQN